MGETISWKIIVAKIANTIPIAATRFPFRADFGFPIILSPTIKVVDPIKYASEVIK